MLGVQVHLVEILVNILLTSNLGRVDNIRVWIYQVGEYQGREYQGREYQGQKRVNVSMSVGDFVVDNLDLVRG